jgi:hypothetical protein
VEEVGDWGFAKIRNLGPKFKILTILRDNTRRKREHDSEI